MAIADRTHFWTSRLNGNNPASPNGDNNAAWTRSGSAADGAVVGDNWRIVSTTGGQTWSVSSDTSCTLVAAFKFNTPPNDTESIMSIDNGTHRVDVLSKGGVAQLSLVGSSTQTTHDLDLGATTQDAVPILLRLTLAASGAARLYMREIIEDDDANTHYLSVTGASSTASGIKWGNITGSVDWYSVYATTHGAFSPDEMAISDFETTSFIRTGLNVVEVLRSSKRLYLKSHVTSASIHYGYDVSSGMMGRQRPPVIHVLLEKLDSPQFMALSGSRTEQQYVVTLYITTRGTDYRNAYRQGIAILGECFDELYTNTGLSGGIDSLEGYTVSLDTKTDDDEVICVHTLTLNYMKKVNMTRREA